jgi:hypothetical protein
MSRTNFSPSGGRRFFLRSSPRLGIRGKALLPGHEPIGVDPGCEIAIRSISIGASSTASLNASSGLKPSGLCWQPGFYLRLEAYGFMGLSEGAYSLSRDSVPRGTLGLTAKLILSLEPGVERVTDDDLQGKDIDSVLTFRRFRRLALSAVQGRSELLSSIGLRSKRPVCASGSNGPSRGTLPVRSGENTKA